VCGDGRCESFENTTNCPGDCTRSGSCGDGYCGVGESASNCSRDCDQQGHHFCGDLLCEDGLENSANCPGDCPP
jgi:hypothetical protein